MRINKRKLAALMMSAVMAASTMSTLAFAEDGTVVVEENVEEVLELAADVSASKITDVEINDENGVVTVTYGDGTVAEWPSKASGEVTPPSCETGGYTDWSISIDGETYHAIGNKTDPLGHDFGSNPVVEEVTKSPTCEETGESLFYQHCDRCGQNIYQKGDDGELRKGTVGTIAHDKNKVVVTYEAGTNTELVKDSEGNVDATQVPVLEDENQNGSYTKKVAYYCSMCEKYHWEDLDETTIETLQGDVSVKYVRVELDDSSNIDNSIMNLDTSDYTAVPDDEDIQLIDCKKNGYYYIVEYSITKEDIEKLDEGADLSNYVVYKTKHPVAAHHTIKKVTANEFRNYYKATNTNEQGLLTPVLDDDKQYVVGVSNQSCYKSVEYEYIEECAVDGCTYTKKETKTAEPEGKCVPDSEVTNALQDLLDAAYQNGNVAPKSAYDTFAEKVGDDEYVSVKLNNTCESDGTVTVTTKCVACKKEISEETVKVKQLGHIWDASVKENVVEATCSKAGSYDLVEYCSVCGEREVVQEGIKIPKLAHSFEDGKGNIDDTDAYIKFVGTVVVDSNSREVASFAVADVHTLPDSTSFASMCYAGYTVSVNIGIKCENCGEVLYIPDGKTIKVATLEITNLTKETTGGAAGSITLKATYKKAKTNKTITETITVPYYSSIGSYLDSLTDEEKIDGLHKDADGVYRYYEDGVFQEKYTGIVKYESGEFFVANGVLCSGANGLNRNEADGKWYFLANGQVQRGFNGLALYDSEWFYLINGELNTSVKGLVPYEGGQFLFAAGRLVKECNGLWLDFDGTWYFLARGQVQLQYTGTVTWNGVKYQIEAGKVIL